MLRRKSFRAVILFLAMLLLTLAGAGKAQQQTSASPAPDASGIESLSVEKAAPPPDAYAGDAACATCHAGIAASYARTSHHATSQLPTQASIGGSFAPGDNLLHTANPRLVFEMNLGEGAFTETARYQKLSGEMQELTLPIDLVIGSGRKGQTYLYWNGDQLFELPVSYWTATRKWINSPGFVDGMADFNRVIPPQCLECHASYFTAASPPINRFVKTSLVLGIFCEKCHGPGKVHVEREQGANPPRHGSPEEAIVNPAHLARERQLDTCALCHAGPIAPLAPALSFIPGDRLADYVKTVDLDPNAPLDVHTNQVQLLQRSRCYQASSMTCTTCHNVHLQQHDTASFSARCLTCHKVQACPRFKELKAAIRTRCVDCHMPLQTSTVLFSDSEGHRLNPQIRNHRIAIYPESHPEAKPVHQAPAATQHEGQ